MRGNRVLQELVFSPVLHFVVLGVLLFVVSLWREPSSLNVASVTDQVRIEIPPSRVTAAERIFQTVQRRSPTVAERTALIDGLVDEEILFRHALALGLHRSEVPRRRLAQIASFVEPTGSPADKDALGAPSIEASAELASRAVELGLHEGDFVTRRVLIDASRRLIRAAARVVEPSEEAVAEFLRTNSERFRREDRFRVSHVLQSQAIRESPSEDAVRLLAQLQRDGVSPEDSVAFADPGIVSPGLPLLGVRALERRFGAGFAAGLAALPTGEWTGPVPSRHGTHLIFIHEYRPGDIRELVEVRDKIRALLREEAADRWLAARLRQLRDDYEIGIMVDTEIVEATPT